MAPTIIIKPTDPIPASSGPSVMTHASFEITFQGIAEGKEIELILWEINEEKPSQSHENDTKIATLKGNLQNWMDTPNGPILGMNVVSNDAETFGTARIGFK